MKMGRGLGRKSDLLHHRNKSGALSIKLPEHPVLCLLLLSTLVTTSQELTSLPKYGLYRALHQDNIVSPERNPTSGTQSKLNNHLSNELMKTGTNMNVFS